jgi:hypothetical protein
VVPNIKITVVLWGQFLSGLSRFSLKVAEKCLLGQGEQMANVTGMQNNKSNGQIIYDDKCILFLIIIFIL